MASVYRTTRDAGGAQPGSAPCNRPCGPLGFGAAALTTRGPALAPTPPPSLPVQSQPLAQQPIALTCDDAPAIASRGPVRFDPQHMDDVREVLTAAGVTNCVAFVIGHSARGEEKRLERWLRAGFELGNHADDHMHASNVTARDFLASAERCGQMLASITGQTATRWFRFPYLDRGVDRTHRSEIQRGILELGYRIAPASVDFYDYAYEEPFVGAGNDGLAAKIAARYRHVAHSSVVRRAAQVRARMGRQVPLVSFFHFGPISSRFIGDIVRALTASGVQWCPLARALDDPYYRNYLDDTARNGLVTEQAHELGIGTRLLRRLAREADRCGFASSRQLGPRWPHVT